MRRVQNVETSRLKSSICQKCRFILIALPPFNIEPCDPSQTSSSWLCTNTISTGATVSLYQCGKVIFSERFSVMYSSNFKKRILIHITPRGGNTKPQTAQRIVVRGSRVVPSTAPDGGAMGVVTYFQHANYAHDNPYSIIHGRSSSHCLIVSMAKYLCGGIPSI